MEAAAIVRASACVTCAAKWQSALVSVCWLAECSPVHTERTANTLTALFGRYVTTRSSSVARPGQQQQQLSLFDHLKSTYRQSSSAKYLHTQTHRQREHRQTEHCSAASASSRLLTSLHHQQKSRQKSSKKKCRQFSFLPITSFTHLRLSPSGLPSPRAPPPSTDISARHQEDQQ